MSQANPTPNAVERCDPFLEQCPSLLCECVLEYKHEAEGVRVMCISCGTSGPWRDDMDEAAEEWNDLVRPIRDIVPLKEASAAIKADNARLRDVARAADDLANALRNNYHGVHSREGCALCLALTAYDSARSSGARGGGE